ncbi:hypothetical protein FXO38_16457 [Capsicum annuum]|nr:hypothetical protein FXO38_16457 [Capsicum annuum]KAF3665753.1 hypothetical protein FXO37_10896 [Capsicum annuum]
MLTFPKLLQTLLNQSQPNQVEDGRQDEAKEGEKNLAQEGELCEVVDPRIGLNDINKEHLVVELVKPKPLLYANHRTSILPSTNNSLLLVHQPMLPKENSRKPLMSISLKA